MVVALVALFLGPTLSGQVTPSPVLVETSHTEEINDGGDVLRTIAGVSSAWRRSPDGLALEPESVGDVVFHVNKTPEQNVTLLLWFYSDEFLRTAVECSIDGAAYQTLVEDVHLVEQEVDFSGCAVGVSDVWIRLSANYWRVPPEGHDRLVLDKVEIRAPGSTGSSSFRLLPPRIVPASEGSGPRASSPSGSSSLSRVSVVSAIVVVLLVAILVIVLVVWTWRPRRTVQSWQPRQVVCRLREQLERTWATSDAAVQQPVAPLVGRVELAIVLVAAAAAFLVALAGDLDQARIVRVESTYDDALNDSGASLRRLASVSPGWRWADDGLALEPGSDGDVTWQIRKEPDQAVRMALWLDGAPSVRSTILCSGDGAVYESVHRDLNLVGEEVDLSGCGQGQREAWVRLLAELPESSTSDATLVLDRVQLGSPTPRGHRPFVVYAPPTLAVLELLRVMAGLLVVVGVVAGSLRALGASRRALFRAVAATVLVGLLVSQFWPALVRTTADAWGFVWSVPFALSGLALVGCLMWVAVRGPASRRRGLASVAVAWLLGMAFVSRWDALVDAVHRPLDPDAETVAGFARQMSHLYDTAFREPLWVWAHKLFQLLAGPTDLSTRLFSLTLSLLLLYLAYRFVRDYTGSLVLGWATCLLLARNEYLVASSVRGLRTELYVVTLLVLMYFAFVPGVRQRARSIGLALGTVLVALTQLSGLAFALVLAAWGSWRHRLGWKTLVVTAVAAVVCVTPHLVNNAREYGDPIWSQNIHAVWYRNLEYVGVQQSGCEGCPTVDEYEADAYSGTRTSMVRYVFGMHPLSEVIGRIGLGYGLLYVWPGNLLSQMIGTTSWLGYLLYGCGLVLMATTRMRELLLVPLLSVNLLAFVIPLGIDPRLVIHPVPIAAFAMALAIWWGLGALVVGLRRVARLMASWPRTSTCRTEMEKG